MLLRFARVLIVNLHYTKGEVQHFRVIGSNNSSAEE